jgi:hypothetical protein
MTPEQVYAMSDEEYRAFVGYMREERKAQERANRTTRR